MIHQNLVHLARADFFAAAVDDFLEPPCEGDIAIVIHHPLVTGAEPTVCEGLCIGFGVALVTGRDVGATDDDLAGAAAFQQRAILGHDGHLRASGNAHAAGLAHGWRQGVAGHLVRGLGHAVAFNQGGAKHFLHLADHLGWHGARGAANEAQRVPCDHVGAFRGARQDGLVHGGHGREPGGAGLVHPSKKLQCIEAGGTKHHGTG